MKICDLKEGTKIFNETFLINDVVKKTANNGTVFLSFIFQDNSGLINGIKWVVLPEETNLYKKNMAIIIRSGRVVNYNNRLQLTIEEMLPADEKSIDLNKFAIESPVSKEILVKEFLGFKNNIQNKNLKLILDEIFNRYYDDFIEYPAASKNHHEFHNGLLYHSVSMAKLAKEITKLYNDIDYDLLISGCLVHDIGKVVELSGVLSTSYTTEGILLGHVSIGASIIKEIADELHIEGEEPVLLMHMLLSHHGKLEFGSPVLPHTREALLLSMIDDLDAKMMILDKAYKNVNKGEFTEKIFALDNIAYYKKK